MSVRLSSESGEGEAKYITSRPLHLHHHNHHYCCNMAAKLIDKRLLNVPGT